MSMYKILKTVLSKIRLNKPSGGLVRRAEMQKAGRNCSFITMPALPNGPESKFKYPPAVHFARRIRPPGGLEKSILDKTEIEA